jgi:hypothetical protein
LFKNSSANSSSSASSSSSSSTNSGSQFWKDLRQWMVSSNISLEKLHNKNFRKILQTYTCRPIPSESTLRKNYLSTCYEVMLNKIRTSVADNKIWVFLDETSDVDGRYIANVIVGTLKQDQSGDIFLLIHSPAPSCGTIASVAFVLWRVKQAANKLCCLLPCASTIRRAATVIIIAAAKGEAQ